PSCCCAHHLVTYHRGTGAVSKIGVRSDHVGSSIAGRFFCVADIGDLWVSKHHLRGWCLLLGSIRSSPWCILVKKVLGKLPCLVFAHVGQPILTAGVAQHV